MLALSALLALAAWCGGGKQPDGAAGSAAPLTRAGSPPPPSAAAQENLVQTQAGAVRGVIYNEARAFLGVPYAEPPVGPRRWAAPTCVTGRD